MTNQTSLCSDPEFCQRMSNFDFFQFDEERKDQNTTISGPSSAQQRNSETSFKWHFTGVPMMALQ